MRVKKIFMAAFVVVLSTFCISEATADPSVEFRRSVYTKFIEKYSDSKTLELQYSEQSGFFATARRDISSRETLFKIPYEDIITSYAPFPHKNIVLKTLKKMDIDSESWRSKYGIPGQNTILAITVYI